MRSAQGGSPAVPCHLWSSAPASYDRISRGSVRRVNDRRVLNGIFWVLSFGAPWRDLPEYYGIAGLRLNVSRASQTSGSSPLPPRPDARRSLSASADPRISSMLGDARHRLVVALAMEEFSDLIGHVDEPVRHDTIGLPEQDSAAIRWGWVNTSNPSARAIAKSVMPAASAMRTANAVGADTATIRGAPTRRPSAPFRPKRGWSAARCRRRRRPPERQAAGELVERIMAADILAEGDDAARRRPKPSGMDSARLAEDRLGRNDFAACSHDLHSETASLGHDRGGAGWPPQRLDAAEAASGRACELAAARVDAFAPAELPATSGVRCRRRA